MATIQIRQQGSSNSAQSASSDAETDPPSISETTGASPERQHRLRHWFQMGWLSRRPDPSTLFWLAAAVALGASDGPGTPTIGIDQSWMTAINVAARAHRRFGHDILFTYGPWGFLETPLVVSRSQFALGTIFAVVASAALFWAAHVCLARIWSASVAAPLACIIVCMTSVTSPGLWILCAGLVFALSTIAGRRSARQHHWREAAPTAILSSLGALMMQVKFSDGLAILAFAGIMTISTDSLHTLARNTAVGATTFAAAFTAMWLAAGQSLGDVPAWLRGSWELSNGYLEAMGYEWPEHYLPYTLAILLTLVTVALVIRVSHGHRRAVAIGTVLLAVATVEFGFKHGFTRDDPPHEPTFFMLTGFLILWLASRTRRPTMTSRPTMALAAAALAITQVPAGLSQFDLSLTRTHWSMSTQALFDNDYRLTLLKQARLQAIDGYQLPRSMALASQGHPMSIDPWETTLPWTYSFSWNPTPVFQSYSAFTPSLDEMNARAIVEAPADQIILRQVGAAIDERNPFWDPPRYLLALACNYRESDRNASWQLLRHSENHCSDPRTIHVQQVNAGEAVETPQVGQDEILITRFKPKPPTEFVSLSRKVLKDWSPLLVKVDGSEFRLPKALADGPLVTSYPTDTGETSMFDGLHYKNMTFNEPGTLEFQVITVR